MLRVGDWADIIVVNDLKKFEVLKTFINGVEKLSLTSLTMPTANLFTKLGFDRGVNDSFFIGNVKSVLVFPTQLTDQQCISLTTL